MKQMKNKYIDINKKYTFPSRLSKVRYKDKILLISIDTACWLVFDNEKQYVFFDLLRIYPIKDALEKFEGEKSDAVYVITQIEAKQFEDKTVVKASQDLLHLYLTNACNMHCPHCYMFAGNRLDDELTTEEVKIILQNYVEKGGRELTISGGEATMREDLVEIMSFAYKIGLKTKLLTNGYMLSDELIDNISPLTNYINMQVK